MSLQLDILGEVNPLPKFIRPPVPFVGNKAHYLDHIYKVARLSKCDTIVDAFGGSGIISHEMKRRFPEKRVIWNDFDDYADRLKKLPAAREIYKKFDAFCSMNGIKKHCRLPDELRDEFYEKHLVNIDTNLVHVPTISIFLHFSGRRAWTFESLKSTPMWNIYFNTDPFDLYLEGVDRVQQDAFSLIKKGHLIIADPPYPINNASCDTHYCDNSFTVEDCERLVSSLIENGDFMFFTSSKSEVVNLDIVKMLTKISVRKNTYSIKGSTSYDDIMYTNLDLFNKKGY